MLTFQFGENLAFLLLSLKGVLQAYFQAIILISLSAEKMTWKVVQKFLLIDMIQ